MTNGRSKDRWDSMSQYWFKPKTYGYGATPANWKGWAAVAGYVAVVTALTLPLLALAGGHASRRQRFGRSRHGPLWWQC